MGNALFVLAMVGILIFAGCASQEQNTPQQANQNGTPTGQPQPPANNGIHANNSTAVEQNQTLQNSTQNIPTDGCTVQFFKDVSNIFYVTVATSSQKTLEVTCPNGEAAKKVGELFFCTQLDVPNPAIAKLDGTECGRAQFSRTSFEAKPAGKTSCSVLLSQSRITVGTTTVVSVKLYAPGNGDVLSYNCGSEEIVEKVSGLVDTGKICKFDTAGTIEIYAKLNNQTCANSFLEVFEKAHECHVLSSAFEKIDNDYVYTANVSGRGYSSDDTLRYACFGTAYGKKVGEIQNSTDFIYKIECRSSTGPLADTVPVAVSNDNCGSLVPLSS